MIKQEYEKHKEKGLCSRCGKPSRPGRVVCEDCAKWYRETRQWYLALGFCPSCHKERVYGSEKQCPECRAKRIVSNQLATQKAIVLGKEWAKPEYNNANNRKRYAERKEQGICIKCGKRPAENGKTRCRLCLDKAADRAREYRARLKEEKMGEMT